MRLKSYFYILALLLFMVWVVLLMLVSGERSAVFYIAEGVIITCFVFLLFFYRKVIMPLDIIGNGMDLLKEQDFSSRLIPVGQFEADRIVNIFNRMMDQLKEERLRLREQNHFLDLLISASPMGVVILSFDGKVSMANKAALNFLGFASESDIKEKSIEEIESSLAGEINNIAQGESETVRLSDSMIYRCSRLSFFDRGFMHPFILIESLTSEVVKAEKKAYEQVIRMIAHEVNNTVAGITSTLDTVDSVLESFDDAGELRDVMRVCVERSLSMSNFITRFANVVKIPEPQLQTVSLNDCVSSCKSFMENICRASDIKLTMDLCVDNPRVNIDTLLFEQVLVNIIKNSAESILQDGEIVIRTSSSPLMLEVADSGTGISKDVETKLFSPFFSTKPNGQGIGLILIREILIRHGCRFSLRTHSDGLTRFRIHFDKSMIN